jgi:cytochrome c550
MKRNPVIPFVLIMVFGIVLIFILSFKGLDQSKDIAKGNDKGTGSDTAQTSAQKPEDIYTSTCIGCHGDQYQGGVGPALKGVGKRLSTDEIQKIITQGKTGAKGTMPPGLVKESDAKAMAEWVSKIQ